ncbi:Rieske 2Fe-2S domain-containing protein [Segetibacter sp.]|jgi:nitrite reductase/ring-hydroxylating ferredoxin subunit|uniref:Rieske (2Fe-2S) protein n=1 Tax=Segetibacter sp. TaxID=2231182 RepID=UPI00262C0F51|nr:Rieske 2Fe-2S domain-containing protein [Segetibacter sp.]MCW3082152.1 ferredoxin [Segetibacter sp.]
MAVKNIKWFKVADSKSELQWQDNNLMVKEVGGKKITLAQIGNEVFACAHKCPHAGGLLADGFIDATGNIVCPLHRYKFNLGNGRNVSGEGYYLKIYALEEREAGIFVGFEENSWLNIFK